MTDTQWADVSSWQPVVDDSYPYQVLAIRSNDGTFIDPNFTRNYAWGLNALASGKLAVLIVYFVYRQNWQTTVNTHTAMLGSSHRGVVSMIDVESWGDEIVGDQSEAINSCVSACADFHRDPRRVIGYGNVGDLNALWPSKPPGLRLVVAGYGSNPDYPGKLAHQYADDHPTPPFGACDINSADGYTLAALCDALGLSGGQPPAPPSPAPAGFPTLVQGSTGELVWRLQQFMNRVFPAYSHIDAGPGPSSVVGPETMAAVTEFQRRSGIPTAPPFAIGPHTWAALSRAGFR